METFQYENIQLHLLDQQDKSFPQTKPEKDIVDDIAPLTPDIMSLPLRHQSILLKDCLLNKIDVDNPQIWKVLNSQNFWFAATSVYYQPPDFLHLKSPKVLRESLTQSHAKIDRKEYKFIYLNPERAEIQDNVFICESKMIALKNYEKVDISIDDALSLWENELISTSNALNIGISQINGNMEEQKLEQQNVNRLLEPASYRPDLIGFQYMNYQDIEAQRIFEQALKINSTKTFCCVCNLQSLDDCKFLFCIKCKSSIHNKCYVIATEVINQEQFVCWSCSTPDQINYNGQKCCLCNVEGGIMGTTELMSNHELVIKKYHPQLIFDIQPGNDNQFILNKKVNSHINIIPFKTRAHLSCAFWHSQCYYNRRNEQFQGLLSIKQKKWKYPCKVCDKMNGAVIECSDTSCSKVYHAQCARKSNISMSVVKIGKLNKQIFCQKHRIKYSYQKVVLRRYQRLKQIKKLFNGIEKMIGAQGFVEKKPSKKVLKNLKSKMKNTQFQESNVNKFCICRKGDTGGSMIECDKCFEWFHFQCVKIKSENNFKCPMCFRNE